MDEDNNEDLNNVSLSKKSPTTGKIVYEQSNDHVWAIRLVDKNLSIHIDIKSSKERKIIL